MTGHSPGIYIRGEHPIINLVLKDIYGGRDAEIKESAMGTNRPLQVMRQTHPTLVLDHNSLVGPL